MQNSRQKSGQFAALAALCILAGALLTLENVGVIEGVWRLWPIFPLILGLGGVWLFKIKGRDLVTLGMGVYITLISIFFFVLNYTSWTHIAKFWPVFIGVFGISILSIAFFAEKKRWFATSGFFFIFLAVTFFMVFTLDASLWPISLILFGIWILLIPGRRKDEKKSNNS